MAHTVIFLCTQDIALALLHTATSANTPKPSINLETPFVFLHTFGNLPCHVQAQLLTLIVSVFTMLLSPGINPGDY